MNETPEETAARKAKRAAEATAVAVPAAPPTPTAPVAPQRSMLAKDVTCRAVAAIFDAGSKLSDVQKETLWKNYVGKSFTWDLQVVEVSEGMFGGYTLQAKCSPRSDSLIQDIMIEFDRHQEARVMRLVKGKTYSFNGKLTRYSNFVGLTAEDE